MHLRPYVVFIGLKTPQPLKMQLYVVKNVFVLAILACNGVQVAFQRNWKLSWSTHNKKCTFSCAIEHNLNCFYMLFEKGPADIFIMTSNSPIVLQIAVNNTRTLGNLVWLKQLSHKHCTLWQIVLAVPGALGYKCCSHPLFDVSSKGLRILN